MRAFSDHLSTCTNITTRDVFLNGPYRMRIFWLTRLHDTFLFGSGFLFWLLASSCSACGQINSIVETSLPLALLALFLALFHWESSSCACRKQRCLLLCECAGDFGGLSLAGGLYLSLLRLHEWASLTAGVGGKINTAREILKWVTFC